jgi:hypothetical protein
MKFPKLDFMIGRLSNSVVGLTPEASFNRGSPYLET